MIFYAFRTPVMEAGGLFVISRDWFLELGAYDQHLKDFGVENFGK